MSAPPITPLMLAAAALLVLLDAGLSLALGLGMARALLVAALRTVVQLLLVGLAAWIIWRAYQNREAARWTPPRWPAQKPVATAEANESRAAQG